MRGPGYLLSMMATGLLMLAFVPVSAVGEGSVGHGGEFTSVSGVHLRVRADFRVVDDDAQQWRSEWRDDGDEDWGGGVWLGPAWAPYWSRPPVYVYAPPVRVYQSPPVTYIERGATHAKPYYWYHCATPKGYYPYVKRCPSGWTRVIPHPPRDAR